MNAEESPPDMKPTQHPETGGPQPGGCAIVLASLHAKRRGTPGAWHTSPSAQIKGLGRILGQDVRKWTEMRRLSETSPDTRTKYNMSAFIDPSPKGEKMGKVHRQNICQLQIRQKQRIRLHFLNGITVMQFRARASLFLGGTYWGVDVALFVHVHACTHSVYNPGAEGDEEAWNPVSNGS